jgi:dynein heavy chain
MISKIKLAFGLDDETVLKCIDDNRKRFDGFLYDLETSPKLFFFYQPRQFKKNELFMSVGGDGDKLEGKCLYFIRNSSKPIKDTVAMDATVLCGELSSRILETFEETLATVYSPLLAQQKEWGQIKQDGVFSSFFPSLRFSSHFSVPFFFLHMIHRNCLLAGQEEVCGTG